MEYKTVSRSFIAETEERKSRFIAHLVPIAEFDETLARLRNEHRKANHHVTAFRQMLHNGQIQEIGKDDGEPAGTSGMPLLKTMIGADLMDAGIIVTRYFGGVKLGTGGLARAYSAAGKAVMEHATLVPWIRLARRTIHIGFDAVSAIEQHLAQSPLSVVARNYTETGVEMTLEGEENLLAGFTADY